jgi:hypothetical protein
VECEGQTWIARGSCPTKMLLEYVVPVLFPGVSFTHANDPPGCVDTINNDETSLSTIIKMGFFAGNPLIKNVFKNFGSFQQDPTVSVVSTNFIRYLVSSASPLYLENCYGFCGVDL